MCAGQESWAEWAAGHAGCCWAEHRAPSTPGRGAQPQPCCSHIQGLPSQAGATTTCNSTTCQRNTFQPATTCDRCHQKWRVTHRPSSQDGLLSEMLLLRQPAHRRPHDGRDDPRPQCLLHRPHGTLPEQEVGTSDCGWNVFE